MPTLQSLTFYGEGVWHDSGHTPPDDAVVRRLNALGGFTRYVFAGQRVRGLGLHAWRSKPVVSVSQGVDYPDRWQIHYIWSKSELQVPHLGVTIPRDLLRTPNLERWFGASVRCLQMLLSAMDAYTASEIQRMADLIQEVARGMDYTMLGRRTWAGGAELVVKADVLGNQSCAVRLQGDADLVPVDLVRAVGRRDWALLNKVEIDETLKRARFKRSRGVFEVAVPYYTPLREWVDLVVDGETGLCESDV